MPHVLRHTCASRLAQNGVDIKRIQEYLGHKTLAMTLRYAHLAPKHLDVCVDALNEFEVASAAKSAARKQPDAARVNERRSSTLVQ